MRNFLLFVFVALFVVDGYAQGKEIIHPEHQEKSTVFAVTVGSRELFVESYKTIHYVDFTLDKPMAIRIVYSSEIRDYIISPMVRGIGGKQESGGILSFEVKVPGFYVVEINGQDKLAVFANDPVSEKVHDRKNQVSILDYVPDNRGETVCTAAIQRALNDISGSGRTLVFPSGIYRTGTLVVGSNSDICLEKGAILKGSEDRDDYPTDENRLEADHIHNKENYTDNGEFMTFSRLLLIDSAENVHLYGRGIIDGSGSVLRAQGKPANLIRVRRSKNVLIEDLILRDPAAWNTHIQYSDDVTVRRVKIINDPEVHNTDGIDPDASHNVLVEDCFAFCSDDNIAIKTTNNMNLNRDLEDITVRGCVFLTRKSALKVGTETKGRNMKNIRFENNDVVMCDRGLVLYNNDGCCFENIRFINNRIEKNYPDSQRRAIHFSIKERYGRGIIKNVLIRDCVFYNAFPRPSVIEGLDGEACVDGIVFDNVTVAGKRILSSEDGQIAVDAGSVRNISFK